MKQKDKHIMIAVFFVIIFIIIWTMTKYSVVKEEAKTLQKETEQLDTNTSENEMESQKQPAPTVIKTISPTKLQQLALSSVEDVLIIDARNSQNYNEGHIKNSIHISTINDQEFKKTIIFVTETGDEKSLLDLYRELPNSSIVYNLSGGINAWENEKFNLIKTNIEKTFENQSKIALIEPRDLNDLLSDPENLLIIDTRRSGNYKKGHIPNAINMPFAELENLSKNIQTTKKVYIYGTNSDTSFESGVLLYDLGISGAKTINGGFEAWRKYGYPIIQ